MSTVADLKWFKALRRAKVPLSGEEIYSTVIPMWVLNSPTCSKEVACRRNGGWWFLFPTFDENVILGTFDTKRHLQDFCEANSLALIEKDKA